MTGLVLDSGMSYITQRFTRHLSCHIENLVETLPYGVRFSGLVAGNVLRLVSAGKVDDLDLLSAGAALIPTDPAHTAHEKSGTWLVQRIQMRTVAHTAHTHRERTWLLFLRIERRHQAHTVHTKKRNVAHTSHTNEERG